MPDIISLFDNPDFEQWFNNRPVIIQEGIRKLPPDQMYRFRLSKKQCYILFYHEPEDPEEPVSVTVQKRGIGGALAKMGLSNLDRNKVFGVLVDNLEPWIDEHTN